MKFTAKQFDLLTHKSPCLVVGLFEGKLTPAAAAVDAACDKALSALLKRKDITGKCGQTLLLPTVNGIAAERLLLVGLGKAQEVNDATLRKAAAKMAEALKALNIKSAAVAFDGLDAPAPANQARIVAESIGWATYLYHTTKGKKPEAPTLAGVELLAADKKDKTAKDRGLAIGAAIAAGSNVTRELGNLPANVCTPTYLAEQAKAWAKGNSQLKTTVLERKDMEKLGMGSLLSVAAGSDQPPKLIVMEYSNGKAGAKPVVLVGKGVTFDTGGISLKPGEGMDEMKYDMCGAASVFGAMHTALELNLKINLVCIVPATENMPNGHATKPGDVVTSMSGQTIEILNTDAEGRLILCDALTYAERFKPKAVVDVATLTGACVIALGHHATAVYANKQELADKLLEAGQAAADKAWQMPLWDEYQSQLDSNFADMANIGGRPGGSVTAACFLSRFTKSYPWAHLDIAGTAWKSGAAKGATGRPVPLLAQFLMDQAG
ncbi:leucyl aminopeptidase [Simiduia sp. 21SJ11W-1]|uniref:leucyl aminopeptidase n=1 Tax=Simiduia sp. 21SJ11W-1 TaxID=2909669 RepID=UPI0020A14DF8|nr:leucyl aminopeptidase [Simiduia sp. 21SJ11W-1]UTA49005.1 leucyl aminopeptidase [Simiduia sp. 21SJ11W-1]